MLQVCQSDVHRGRSWSHPSASWQQQWTNHSWQVPDLVQLLGWCWKLNSCWCCALPGCRLNCMLWPVTQQLIPKILTHRWLTHFTLQYWPTSTQLSGCPSRGLDLLPGHGWAWLEAGRDLRADDQQWACEEALQQPCALNCTPQAVLGEVLLQGRLMILLLLKTHMCVNCIHLGSPDRPARG